jgi:hypothetical protein
VVITVYISTSREPVLQFPHKGFPLAVFLITAILVGVTVVSPYSLICIFLLIQDVEHLFTCVFGICIFSLEKCLLISLLKLSCLSIGVVEFIALISYVLQTFPYSVGWILNVQLYLWLQVPDNISENIPSFHILPSSLDHFKNWVVGFLMVEF